MTKPSQYPVSDSLMMQHKMQSKASKTDGERKQRAGNDDETINPNTDGS
jgi:hypothetical protein